MNAKATNTYMGMYSSSTTATHTQPSNNWNSKIVIKPIYQID